MTEPFDTDETLDFDQLPDHGEPVESSDNDGDELFTQARELFEANGGDISCSKLQRELRIGYSRAARLLDILRSGGDASELAKPAKTFDKKIDPVGASLYGARFVKFQKIEEYRHLIPAFKEYYYKRMIENPKTRIGEITRTFNEDIYDEGYTFYPYPNALRNWRKKWEKDILEKKGQGLAVIDHKRKIQSVLKTRNGETNGIVEYVAPAHEVLEENLQTFAGELMNDAMQQMRDDQENEEMFESDELMRRKTYTLNVFAHVTKMVHGKANILLKASAEKRENANFLMDLMKKATSGEIKPEEIVELRESYKPTENVPAPVA